mmetsp:Transcript_69652/g.115364  ORF Transcript_69652/g.115364 Transcript_69652/m.115364 type:complete len:104 (-) Transcript_69652:54-365(-)
MKTKEGKNQIRSSNHVSRAGSKCASDPYQYKDCITKDTQRSEFALQRPATKYRRTRRPRLVGGASAYAAAFDDWLQARALAETSAVSKKKTMPQTSSHTTAVE